MSLNSSEKELQFLRSVEDKDYPSLLEAAKGVKTHKEWGTYLDPYHVLSQIISGSIPAVIVQETYLVLYRIGSPWHSPSVKYLEELLTLRLYPQGPGRFDDLVDALLHLAIAYNAVGVAVGTALAGNNKALSRLYIRKGFREQEVGLLKLL